jgi:cyclase
MPLAKRVIPCLDVRNGRVVKGIHFVELRDAGDPVKLAEKYTEEGADELVFLDITASEERRDTMKSIVRRVASVIDIPFTVGGGIRSLADAREILLNGADKVSINTAAVKNPSLIKDLMSIFGKQCVVVAIDAKRNHGPHRNGTLKNQKNPWQEYENERYWFEVTIYGGKQGTGIDAIEWAKQAEEIGAGEILLTSVDADGTENGYDIELTKCISDQIGIPVIASGGCGEAKDILELFKETNVEAALAASIFHYNKYTVAQVKDYLGNNGIRLRR